MEDGAISTFDIIKYFKVDKSGQFRLKSGESEAVLKLASAFQLDWLNKTLMAFIMHKINVFKDIYNML